MEKTQSTTKNTLEVIKSIRGLIFFKESLIKVTQDEIKNLHREIDFIKQNEGDPEETPLNQLQANGQQH